MTISGNISPGHKIDNTAIFPGAGYLTVVLDMITEILVSCSIGIKQN